ncbi:MAG TPA: aminotransferase class III-fold pyridoxal phosphate-dependent enzyme, partial [Candidatus Egerieicola pullicola]|nr:aminotransferase class III-fold pyridoxal phosphate-dependent enzyme [Candidatus Egerieicola pullicola]
HTSNLYYTTPDIALAQKLCNETGYQKAFFCNSGAEANEALLKIARKYSFDKYGKGRHTIITLVNSFHGRTMNTLTATGQEVFHNFFFPFAEGFRYAQPTWEGVQEQLDDTVCGILIEPIQGEGGVCPLDKEFVRKLAQLCAEKDILLLCDEVQTGIGRTGKLLAAEWFDVKPDVVSLAKGLGGGLPIGAVLCNEKTQNVLGPSHHGTTFGGNPVVCAGALVCINRIADPAFLQQVQEKGDLIRSTLSQSPEVEDIAGLGMMLGIRLKTKTAKDVANAALEAGVLVLTAKEKVRLLPPLTITKEELTQALDKLLGVLNG